MFPKSFLCGFVLSHGLDVLIAGKKGKAIPVTGLEDP
jgi:hypothetical protein